MKKIFLTLTLGLALLFTLISMNSCSDNSVNSKKLPIADFVFSPNGGYSPCTVQFTSKSTIAIDFIWDFGDGSTSIAENPSHVFSQPGTYTITLKVKNKDGQNQKSAQITILRPYTKAILTKVEFYDMPFIDASGSGWDPFDGPDLGFQLLGPNPTNTVLYTKLVHQTSLSAFMGGFDVWQQHSKDPLKIQIANTLPIAVQETFKTSLLKKVKLKMCGIE
jgi:PKD repeat protein